MHRLPAGLALPGTLWFRSPDAHVGGVSGFGFLKRMGLRERKINIMSLHVKTWLGDSEV